MVFHSLRFPLGFSISLGTKGDAKTEGEPRDFQHLRDLVNAHECIEKQRLIIITALIQRYIHLYLQKVRHYSKTGLKRPLTKKIKNWF